MFCTYRKHNDAWCIQVTGDAKPGDVVQVTKRDGSSKPETLGEIVGSVEAQDGRRMPVFTIHRPPQQPMATAEVGSLSKIQTLFQKARQHLKFPAIVLAIQDGTIIRINVAGEKSKTPGALNVTSASHNQYGERDWFGRITLDGMFEASRKTTPQQMNAIVPALQAFAADPASEALRSARLTGRCCFCNIRLTDERSTAVGYGATCAAHFGMPWGEARTEIAEMVRPSDEAAATAVAGYMRLTA